MNPHSLGCTLTLSTREETAPAPSPGAPPPTTRLRGEDIAHPQNPWLEALSSQVPAWTDRGEMVPPTGALVRWRLYCPPRHLQTQRHIYTPACGSSREVLEGFLTQVSLGPGLGAQEERRRGCAEEGLLILPHTRPLYQQFLLPPGPKGPAGAP